MLQKKVETKEAEKLIPEDVQTQFLLGIFS